MNQEKRGSNLRSFVVDLTAKDRDPSIKAIIDVLLQGLLYEFSVDANAPSQIQAVGGEE